MQQDHEEGCDYPFKSGEELMKSVSAIDEKQRGELTKMKNLVQMFSCEKISFSGKFTLCCIPILLISKYFKCIKYH